MLKIAVCIKQIPLIEEAAFDPITKTILRDGPNVISAFDLRALSLARDLQQRLGGQTVAVTMGPPQARQALEDALKMGIDRAVHLTDRAFAGADTLATAQALALWLKYENFDLILLGKYSLDAETGQVGPEIAGLLRIAQITGVRRLDISDHRITAERESTEGWEEVEASLPAVITCAERVAQPIKIKHGASIADRVIEPVSAADLSPDTGRFGLAGSPTWVEDIRILSFPRRSGRKIEVIDPAQTAREVVDFILGTGALDAAAEAVSISPWSRSSARYKDVWVVCEAGLDGEVTRPTLELLTAADSLANRSGGAAVAVCIGAQWERHRRLLAGHGADQVLIIDHPQLARYSSDLVAEAMAQAVEHASPFALLVCASETGRDWAPRMAAQLGLGLTGDAIGLEIDPANRLLALKPAFGGNVVAPILSRTYPQAVTVRSGVLPLGRPNRDRFAEVVLFKPELAKPLAWVRASHSLMDSTMPALEGCNRVVGIGTGVGGPDGVAQVSELARALKAAICATRRVTDQGWVPRQLQVGLTGKSIAPRLYIAVGVRGVPNHTVGIKRAGTIVAINNDPQAPIFDWADLGLVVDWAQMVPALTAELLRRRL